MSTVLWNASVRQKQRGVSEGLQELERHRTHSRKLRMRLNQNASLCHFEKKKGDKIDESAQFTQNQVRAELSELVY